MPVSMEIYDSTLRDGAQSEGISFSVTDKIKIVQALDSMGVPYIEAGNPGSNPKDLEFFEAIKSMNLKHSKIVAFGSTRRKNIKVEDDANVKSLLTAGTEHVAIFGKSWDFHATEIIHATLEENLDMIEDTIRFFINKGIDVTFDAEHFFDGFKANQDYAMLSLATAAKAGAKRLVLCDTNGGCLPSEIFEITKKVAETFPMKIIGIHAHNDGGMAVANSIVAVEAGAKHIQGTFVGFGERCGNANLSTIIANLELKMNTPCLAEGELENLTSIALLISEVANINHDDQMPYVGKKAFTHKGGMHIDGVNKNPKSFEHIDPSAVGNARRFLMSEVAGRSSILKKIQRVAPELSKTSPQTAEIMARLKELEHDGYQFEGAESSFELVIRKVLGKYKPFFALENFKTMGERPDLSSMFSAYAMVKVNVDGDSEMVAAEGDGPVNALDKALRRALERFYPELTKIQLTDYKVRVLDGKEASAAKVRVLITSSDGKSDWTTVGVSTDIVEASLIALVDSLEISLIRDIEEKMKVYI